jgi:ketosteroid isomerase-like protein
LTNVELVCSISAASERGELLQPAAAWAHPEIEWVIADGPTAGSWKGVAGMAESIRGMLSAWDDLRIYLEEYRALDDERVLVLLRRAGRGKTSGIELGELHTRGAAVYHVHDGKVTKIVSYYDRDRAFADLGLAPEGEL